MQNLKPMDEQKTEQSMSEFDATLAAILEVHGNSLDKAGRVHQSFLYKGKERRVVHPDSDNVMSPERRLVRHLSTVLLCLHRDFVEVQAAVVHATKTIHVSCNKGVRRMKVLVPTSEDFTLDNFIATVTAEVTQVVCEREGNLEKRTGVKATRRKREKRHFEKLLKIEARHFGHYKLTVAHPAGTNGEHAETKILSVVGNKLDYIGGTRRPCTSCFLFMQLKLESISAEKYNKHHGAFWCSKVALAPVIRLVAEKLEAPTLDQCSLTEIYETLKHTTLDSRFYYNEGLCRSQQDDFDTDSEGESDENE